MIKALTHGSESQVEKQDSRDRDERTEQIHREELYTAAQLGIATHKVEMKGQGLSWSCLDLIKS